MNAKGFIVSCPHCGTAYTTRSWYWLDAVFTEVWGELGLAVMETRQCAVPGCCSTLTRHSEVTLAVACAGGAASNDVR